MWIGKDMVRYLLLAFLCLAQSRGLAQSTTTPPQRQEASADTRDGQHDFDPLIGQWKYHLKRRLHPLTGSNTWVEGEGTGACFKLWDGGCQVETIVVDGGTCHIEGLTLRTFHPHPTQCTSYLPRRNTGSAYPAQAPPVK